MCVFVFAGLPALHTTVIACTCSASEKRYFNHAWQLTLYPDAHILSEHWPDPRSVRELWSSSVATKFHNSFASRATRLWNTLPSDVNSAKDLAGFKILLGEWLKRMPDRPPVPGYTRQNNNSILDWIPLVSREGEALWGTDTRHLYRICTKKTIRL